MRDHFGLSGLIALVLMVPLLLVAMIPSALVGLFRPLYAMIVTGGIIDRAGVEELWAALRPNRADRRS